MQNGDLRHEAIMALIDLQGGFSALENDLTAESAGAENIINAIDFFIADLQETQKVFKGFTENAGSTPALPKAPCKPGPIYL